MDEKKFLMAIVLHVVTFVGFYFLWQLVIIPFLNAPELNVMQAVAIFLMCRALFLFLEIAK